MKLPPRAVSLLGLDAMPKQPLPDTLGPDNDIAQALARISDDLQTLIASNNRIEALLRVLAEQGLQSKLKHVFKHAKQLRVYELSDGKRSTREIGKLVGVDQKTVSRWWRAWESDYQIVDKAGPRGQFRGRYSLWELTIMLADRTPHEMVESGPQPEDRAAQTRLL